MMNMKQLMSLAICVVGVVLIGYGLYSKRHVSAAETEAHKMAISKNPVVKKVGKKAESMIGGYGTRIRWSLAGGTILLLAGAYGAYYFRTHSRW